MNYYGRRRYRRSAASRAYRRAYSYYGRSKRRASGNQRAARQQRDTSEVNLNIPTKIDAMNYTLTLREGEIDEKIIHTGTYALNLWDLLRKSEFYQSYANMYDQVKINKATIKLIPLQFPIFSNGPTGGLTGSTTASNNFYNSYTIVTAWDRSGLSDEQLEWVNYSKENQNLIIGDAADSDGLYVNLTGAEVLLILLLSVKMLIQIQLHQLLELFIHLQSQKNLIMFLLQILKNGTKLMIQPMLVIEVLKTQEVLKVILLQLLISHQVIQFKVSVFHNIHWLLIFQLLFKKILHFYKNLHLFHLNQLF